MACARQFWAVLAFGLLCQAPATAQEAARIALRAALESAWRHAPQAQLLQARQDEAVFAQNLAQSQLADAARLELGHNRSLNPSADGARLRETEIALSAPLWLPAQQQARQHLAGHEAGYAQAQLHALRLQLAGELRDSLWALAAAQAALEETQDHVQHVEQLRQQAAQSVQAGALARAELLLAQQEVLRAHTDLHAAQTALSEKRKHWQLLSGQSAPPESSPEPVPPAYLQAPSDSALAQHPLLAAARQAQAVASAALKTQHALRYAPPTLGMRLKREQEGRGAASHSLALSVQIPLGANPQNQLAQAAANSRLQGAHIALTQQEMQIKADISVAQTRLQQAQAGLQAAQQRSTLSREYVVLMEKAFRLGERGLAERLRAQTLQHEAQAALAQAHIALGLAQARIHQAWGNLP
ncbi:TolC family protein [Massilia sp. W12]|uniref:TolC family protein n=1 Tax=Massilia sp. W12 TaxID=3126507 RepID=UPI0030CAB8CA